MHSLKNPKPPGEQFILAVYNNEEVCKYVTKYIGKDVDYDIVLKS